ncbi:MAG TPA: GAP family protein [Thermoleophilia bacterium]|nr:GAP family protein [Thermoleophilia bacterium]
MGEVVFLSFVAALSPSLLAATTGMLLLPHAARLMLSFWLGAMLTGVTVGLAIVFALEDSSFEHVAKRTVHPAIMFTLAGLLLLVVLVLANGFDKPLVEWRTRHRAQKGPSRLQQALREGAPKVTFVIGVLLSFPGATYLIALDRLDRLHRSALVTVLIVIGFNLVMNALIEIPMVAFRVSPQWTPLAVERTKALARIKWRTYAIWGLCVIAAGLVLIGVIEAT